MIGRADMGEPDRDLHDDPERLELQEPQEDGELASAPDEAELDGADTDADALDERLAGLAGAGVARRAGVLDEPTVRAIGAPVEGLVLGRYRIVREIARGGMGVLYLARDPRAERDRALADEVALKVVLPRLARGKAQRDMGRFIGEIRALIQVRHPNIVRIYDAGREEGLHYYTMEWIAGTSLRELVHDAKVPLVMALDAAHKVALALADLHGRGLLHRDLKPDNILIDRGQAPFRPVLIDFGLILQRDEDGGFRREVVGTPAFMAPEQTTLDERFGALGPWTDVYGLGATLYCLVTGRAPFLGTKAQAVLQDVQTRAPRAPGKVREGLPPAVDALILRAMAKRPADRFASMEDLAEALGTLVERLRRSIRAAGTWARVKRLLGRG